MLNCPQCIQTELILEDAGLHVDKIMVHDPEERATLRNRYNATTFPILVHPNGQVFVGYHGAQQMIEQMIDLAFDITFECSP